MTFSTFQRVVLFDFENDGFPSFDLLLDSFLVGNGLSKNYLITGFDCNDAMIKSELSVEVLIITTLADILNVLVSTLQD